MKNLSIFIIVITAAFSWCRLAAADRLYHWVDSEGVVHLSQNPPPAENQLIEVMDFSGDTPKPAKTDQPDSGPTPEEAKKKIIDNQRRSADAQAKPEDNLSTACYINGDMEGLYVYVIEYPDPDQVLEKVLYQGVIRKRQSQFINSSTGKIIFSYQRSSDDRTYGDNHADCVNGRVITIP